MTRRNLWIAAAAFAACTGPTQAQSVGVTLKLLEFDLAQPNLENYLDIAAPDGLIDSAIGKAVQQLSGATQDHVKKYLSIPNQLGRGGRMIVRGLK